MDKKERYFVGQIVGSADFHIIDNIDEKKPMVLASAQTKDILEVLTILLNGVEEIKKSL